MHNGVGIGVLDGIRVLEIGHFVAAPFCTRLLADLGAEVIKVEPLTGDPVRQWGAQVDGRSLWWSVHGRNKSSIALDLKSKEGRAVVLDLVEKCDALVENFRPGHLAKLGLSLEALRERRLDLVVAQISGYGQSGPARDKAAFGVIGEAIGGIRYLTNHPKSEGDLPPVRVGVSIGDSIAGLYAAFGVVAALLRTSRSGPDPQYQTIDVALTESVLSMMEGMLPEFGALGLVKQPTGGAIATAAPSNAYPTADGDWMLIAANSEPLFARLLDLMGRQDLAADSRFQGNAQRVKHAAALDAEIASWSRTLEAAALSDLLAAADIPASKVFTAEDIARDPQYIARGMVQQVEDPHFGKVLHPGVVPHFPEGPCIAHRVGRDIGEDGKRVARELLGYSEEKIRNLVESGAMK